MTDQELIKRFNPTNTQPLNPEETEVMRNLTDEQITKLAEAYPNQPTRKTYLILYDKNMKPDRQLRQLSTWQNLRNVRKYSNLKNLIAWEFKGASPLPQNRTQPGKPTAQKVIVDMSAQEAAAELKTKIKKDVEIAEKEIKSPVKEKIVPKADKIKSAIKAAKKTEVKQNPLDKVVNVPDDQNFN